MGGGQKAKLTVGPLLFQREAFRSRHGCKQRRGDKSDGSEGPGSSRPCRIGVASARDAKRRSQRGQDPSSFFR